VIERILKNKDFHNLLFLVIQNIANYVFPFITFSYLVRTLGFENFGLISFVNAVFSYVILVVEYGYVISATKEISKNRNNNKQINKIVSVVLVIKLLLFVLCILLLLMTYPFNKHLSNNFPLYIITIFFAFGQAFIPIWYFQGIQVLKNITCLVFLIIRNKNDILMLQAINGLCSILVLLILYQTMIRKYGFRFTDVNFDDVKNSLKDGWHLFISNISMTFYTNSVSILLGFFHGNIYVGYYSASEKIISAFKALISPVSQIVFPKVSELANISKKSVINYNKKILVFGVFFFGIIGFGILGFSDVILKLVFGSFNDHSDIVLKILSFLPLILFMHGIFALCTLLVYSENKSYSKIIISAGLFNVILGTILIYFLKEIGAALAVIIIELYILVMYIYTVEKKGYSYFKKIK
jgi:PST family polysaccharide transporter